MNGYTSLIRFLLNSVLLFVLSSGNALFAIDAEHTKQNSLQLSYKQLQAQFTQFKALDTKNVKATLLDDFQTQIVELHYTLGQCIVRNTTQQENIKKNQELLGEKQTQEDYAIQVKRTELASQYRVIDTMLKRCSLLNIQLDQLAAEADVFRQALMKQQFFGHEGSVSVQAEELLLLDNDRLDKEFDAIQPILEKIYHTFNSPLLLFALLGAGIGLFWSRKGHFPESLQQSQHFTSPSLVAAVFGIKRISPILFALIAFWLMLIITQSTPSVILLQSVQYALLLFFIFGLVRGQLFPDAATIKRHRIVASTCLLLSWFVITFTLLVYCLNYEEVGRFSNSVVLYFTWLFSLASAALSGIVLLWIVAYKLLEKRKVYGVSLLPIVALLGAVVAGVMGYRNLASLLFFATLNSLIVLLIAFLILRISREFFNGLDQGKMPWQRRLRLTMGVEEGHAFPGVIWLRLLVFITTILLALVSLMSIFGSSHQRIVTMILSVKKGITIGAITFDVLNLVYALLILITVLTTLPFIKKQLVANWLSHSNLSRGAKEATQTLVGYGGVAIAILWALYVAGVNFQSLAIVAGALSVGIGFGLQNIVSNFISGIILLFERPIRRGDWIIVGATEGYVKDISIRSTTIQTFQQADVIVPNSELISNQVTNWVLSDTIGRLQVPIGVAYGSDVSLVMDTLEEIAMRHPDVIDDHPDYSVSVLFLGFGESALNFELRCFVRNVDRRLSVLSAINQGIDREFRKANIEIPFPQRVVHHMGQGGDVKEI